MQRVLFALTVASVAACARPAPGPPPSARPEPPPPAPRSLPQPLERRTFSEAGPEVRDADPELTPDASVLYYATNAYGPDFDICRKPVEGIAVTRIVVRPGSDERMARLHPTDPNVLAFCSNAGGEWHIYRTDLREPERWTRVTTAGSHNIGPSWSPDGRRLVFATLPRRPGAQWELAVHELATQRTSAMGIRGLHPRWEPRPGSRRIIFQQMRGRDAAWSALWMTECNQEGAAPPTLVFESTERAAINPAWAPDGQHIVFAITDAPRPDAPAEGTADDLYISRLDGSELRPLTRDPARDWAPTWAADGRIYFVSQRDGRQNIWSMRVP